MKDGFKATIQLNVYQGAIWFANARDIIRGYEVLGSGDHPMTAIATAIGDLLAAIDRKDSSKLSIMPSDMAGDYFIDDEDDDV